MFRVWWSNFSKSSLDQSSDSKGEEYSKYYSNDELPEQKHIFADSAIPANNSVLGKVLANEGKISILFGGWKFPIKFL